MVAVGLWFSFRCVGPRGRGFRAGTSDKAEDLLLQDYLGFHVGLVNMFLLDSTLNTLTHISSCRDTETLTTL